MENNGSNKSQLIEYQTVKHSIAQEMACMLLRTNVLSKEQRLMGLLMSYVDDEGMVEIIPASRDKICSEIGIANGIWKVYLSKWRKDGLITTSGYWIVFKKYVKKETQGILIVTQPA